MISLDQFAAVSLTVGRIVSADFIEGSEKLLRLSVAVGEEEPRTIVSGIRRHYAPEDLTGKRCVIVSNLEQRTFMGVESNGMLVCVSFTDADGLERVRIVEAPADAPVGSRLS